MQIIVFYGNLDDLDAAHDSVAQEPSFEKEQGEEGADSQLHCTSRTAWPRQNRRIEETPLEALAMLIVPVLLKKRGTDKCHRLIRTHRERRALTPKSLPGAGNPSSQAALGLAWPFPSVPLAQVAEPDASRMSSRSEALGS